MLQFQRDQKLLTENLTRLLAETRWLREQPQAFREWIAGAGTWRYFERNQELFSAGDPAQWLTGIVEGAVDIIYPDIDGRSVIVSREGQGFWIGDLAVLARKPRLVSCYAAAHTAAFLVPRTAITDLLRREPAYWHAFYQLAYENQEISLVLLSEALTLPVSVRLARRLRHLAGADMTVRISQQALADLLGTTRTHLQRSLGALAAQGLIETGYSQVRITDLDGLNTVASGHSA